MRVAYVTSVHPDWDVRIWKTATAIAARGIDTHLVCPWDSEAEVRDGVRLHPFPRISGIGARLSGIRRHVAARLRAIDGALDVVHFHDPDLLPMAAARPVEARYVYDVHENFHQEIRDRDWVPGPLRSPLSWLVDRLERRWAARCDGVVCVVPPQLPRFEGAGLRAVLVRNFASRAMFAGSATAPAEPRTRIVGTTAAHYESNGSLVFLDAARLVADTHPDCRFEVGDRFASDAFRSRFLERRSRLGLDRIVEIVPNVPVDQVPARLARWCVGVSSNLDEPKQRLAIPTKVFEYFAAGVPVVASRLPLIESLVEEQECLLVEPGDESALAAAIRRLLDDGDEAGRRAVAGRRAFEERLNWEGEMAGLVAFYRELVTSPVRRRS